VEVLIAVGIIVAAAATFTHAKHAEAAVVDGAILYPILVLDIVACRA
jgi:hypothetical protein